MGEVAGTFVLVHGAGGGAWCWDSVAPLLERHGFRVFAPSLSGLEDPATGLDRHFDDVVQVLEQNDLEDVLLVGHSYGGMVITGVAQRVPARLARVVYLDAFAPRDGQSAFETRPDLARALGSRATGGLIPPLDPEFAGVDTEEQAQLLRERLTTTPLRVLEEKIVLGDPAARTPRSFVFCTQSGFGETAARVREEGWDYHELPAKHMVMLTMPAELADLLEQIAAAG